MGCRLYQCCGSTAAIHVKLALQTAVVLGSAQDNQGLSSLLIPAAMSMVLEPMSSSRLEGRSVLMMR